MPNDSSLPKPAAAIQKPENKIKTFITDLIMGGFAAGISKTMVAPIETIKLRLQSMDEMVKQNIISNKYTGINDCLIRIIKEEGFFTLWKGNVTNILFYFPTQSLNFAFKAYYKQLFSKYKNNAFLFNIFCGSAAGVTSMLLFHPFDFIKTRLVNDAKNIKLKRSRQYKNSLDVCIKTYHQSGLFGIYRGVLASCMCMFIYRGLYFGWYDTTHKRYKNIVLKFLLGWGVTIFSGAVAYPLDTVRRRMIMTSGTDNSYSNSWTCITTIIKKEGVKSWYQGHAANVMRSLAGAGVLIIYDKIKAYISSQNLESSQEGWKH